MNAALAVIGCVCLVAGGYYDTGWAWVFLSIGGAAIGLLWARAERWV